MPSDINAKLKKADPIIKKYIAELTKRNERLEAQAAKDKVINMSLQNRIKALERELRKLTERPMLTIKTSAEAQELVKQYAQK